MTENEVLGFNPQDLFNNQSNDDQSNSANSLIYKTQPSKSVSEDGHYRAKIKIIYNPENPKNSWLEQQSYGMTDTEGFFSVISSLTINDKSCPIFTSWKKCRYADPKTEAAKYNQALSKDKNGNGMYDKRFARYVIVQIIKDKNQPELVGSFKLWKLPTSIYNLLQNAMKPSEESGKMPIPVLDYLFGRTITIDVAPGPDDPSNPQRKTREITYIGEISKNATSCINPDGSPLLNDEEQEILDAYVDKISKAWDMECEDKDEIVERNALVEKINSSEEYKALIPIYSKVFAQIKEWAPKLDTLSYKPWSDAIKTRVEHWTKIVESGNDPAKMSWEDYLKMVEGEQTDDKKEKSSEEQPKKDVSSTAHVDEQEDNTDDLPF